MNEDEAIKQLKQWLSVIDLKKKSNIIPNTDDIQAIETVLNLLEKKETKIEEYKMLLAKMHGQFLNSDIKSNKKHREDLETLNEGWKIELEKKDKIIDEMAEFIEQHSLLCVENYGTNKEEWKHFFERKIENGN